MLRVLRLRGMRGSELDMTENGGSNANSKRFPADLMVRLNAAKKAEEVANCDLLAQLKFLKLQSPIVHFLQSVTRAIKTPSHLVIKELHGFSIEVRNDNPIYFSIAICVPQH
jgi:hypothetical protein